MIDTPKNTIELTWDAFDPKDILKWLQDNIDAATDDITKNELQRFKNSIEKKWDTITQDEIENWFARLQEKWILQEELLTLQDSIREEAEDMKTWVETSGSTKQARYANNSESEIAQIVKNNKDARNQKTEQEVREYSRIPNRLKRRADIPVSNDEDLV